MVKYNLSCKKREWARASVGRLVILKIVFIFLGEFLFLDGIVMKYYFIGEFRNKIRFFYGRFDVDPGSIKELFK